MVNSKATSYKRKYADDNIFTKIVDLQKQIDEIKNDSSRIKVLIGKVTHKKPDGTIRVVDTVGRNNHATFWLLPSSLMYQLFPQLEIGDFVLYCYPLENNKKGIYFSIIDPEVLLDTEEPIDLSGFATQDWVNTNFYNKTQIDDNFYNETESDALFQTIAQSNINRSFIIDNLVRRYKHNNFIQASKGNAISVSSQWFNTQVTLTCNGSDLPTSGTPTQDALPAIQVNITSTTDSEAVVGTRVYFKIATTARINIAGTNNVVLSGVTNGVFLMPVQTQWYITKTGSLAWSLDSTSYSTQPYLP